MAAQVIRVDAIRSIGFASITASYKMLGTAFGHETRIMCISNNTDGDMLFSFDNSTDNLFVAANGFKLFDAQTNSANDNTYFVFASGTNVFIKYITVPTKGSVYLECIYGKGE